MWCLFCTSGFGYKWLGWGLCYARTALLGSTSRHDGSRLAPNLHICIQSAKWIQPSINNDSLSEAEGWERSRRRQKYPTGITLYCPRRVRPFCVGSAGSCTGFNYGIVFCLHVLENDDTSGLKFSWHWSLANFHMKRELDKWSSNSVPWNKHRI